MKYLIVIFLFMSTGLSGCKEDDGCYELGGTKENCESNPKCRYENLSGRFIFGGKDYFSLYNLMNGWKVDNEISQYRTGLCIEKNNEFVSNGETCQYPWEQDVEMQCAYNFHCLNIYGPLFFVISIPRPPSPDWEPCDKYFGKSYPDAPPTNHLICGNGIIDFDEQCDGTRLGSMADCATHGERLGIGEWTKGNIKCSDTCKWDYSDCQ